MSQKAKAEYFREIKTRYNKASRQEKQYIPDEFCLVCRYNRKYAIRFLNPDLSLGKDFGAVSFNVDDFFATDFVMMGYNLMILFRQAILTTKIHQQLKTLRYKVFAIGSYNIKDSNDRILKLSLAMKRRSWFEGIWSNTNLFSWPFVVSNENFY
jgi:hypothetical protein